MEGKKIYLQPFGTALQVINDMAELQKGKLIFSDSPNGIIHFAITMYGNKWELKFEVTDIGKNRCNVKIEIEEETKNSESLIERQFALLDSMLIIDAKMELSIKKGEY